VKKTGRPSIGSAIAASWRHRARAVKRAIAFALVAAVWMLRSWAAHRAWQRRRSTFLPRPAAPAFG
jgi:hypothetical protein